MRSVGGLLVIGGVAALAFAAQAFDTEYGFIPPGGRTILLGLVGEADRAALAEIATRSATAEEWKAWAAERDATLDDKALDTFAGYARYSFPLDGERLAALVEATGAPVLPADGKDLAIAQCQYCHSLFSGYLMHRRDETGWKGIFKAPFHAEIPMTEAERNTFAHYSAINMPLRFEDVPAELRF